MNFFSQPQINSSKNKYVIPKMPQGLGQYSKAHPTNKINQKSAKSMVVTITSQKKRLLQKSLEKRSNKSYI